MVPIILDSIVEAELAQLPVPYWPNQLLSSFDCNLDRFKSFIFEKILIY